MHLSRSIYTQKAFMGLFWLVLATAASLIVSLGIGDASASAISCPTVKGAPITGRYGDQRHYHKHAGLDLGVSFQPIYAAESGNVVTKYHDGYQITKDLHADNGRVYRYAHLREGGVNGRVNAGDLIGISGNGDGAVAPHLHWEARTNNGFGFNGTLNPTGEYRSCGRGGGSVPTTPPIGGNPNPTGNDCHSVVLRQGSSLKDCVRHAQNHLNDFGAGLVVDGDFGPATKGAVEKFQRNNNLSVDGVIGNNTWSKLHDPSAARVDDLSRPNIAANCNTSPITASIYWSDPGIGGNSGYIVDIDTDGWQGGWWNKNVGTAKSTSSPAGFTYYPTFGPGLRFNHNQRYHVRVYFRGPGVHTPTSTFICNSSSPNPSSPTPPPNPSPTPPPSPSPTPPPPSSQQPLYNRQIKNIGSGKCLDVHNFGTHNGANVQIYSCSGGNNQKWSFFSSDKTIRVYASPSQQGMCLDAHKLGNQSKPANGANIQIYSCSGGQNQKWNVYSDGTIRSYNGTICLDVEGFGTANHSNVHAWHDCHVQSNQRWQVL